MRLAAGLAALFVVAFVFAGLGVPAAGRISPDPSLIRNGDFEAGLACWGRHLDVLWLIYNGDGVFLSYVKDA